MKISANQPANNKIYKGLLLRIKHAFFLIVSRDVTTFNYQQSNIIDACRCHRPKKNTNPRTKSSDLIDLL